MSELKEEFCGICAAVPLALAGLGGTAYAATGAEEKKKKLIIVVSCAVIVVVSILVLIKYSSCSSCLDA